jgi:hypothetical protein
MYSEFPIQFRRRGEVNGTCTSDRIHENMSCKLWHFVKVTFCLSFSNLSMFFELGDATSPLEGKK